jgi:hypothetical protein
VSLISVSTGQTVPDQQPVYGRMWQTPYADMIRNSRRHSHHRGRQHLRARPRQHHRRRGARGSVRHRAAASRGSGLDVARGREPALRRAVVAGSLPCRQESARAQPRARGARCRARYDAGAPLEGRHALVTGAGRGIGAAIAARLAAEGARVTLLSRTRGEINAVAARLGDAAQALKADITDSEATRRAFERRRRPSARSIF